MADETYQSLYRRYRPSRFAEVLGQDHVTLALRNAVREGRVGQGYLFSGPRGTGKTSTARILAKALNCENLADGEPCGTCESCITVAAGTSFDAHELDAASNNGVDNMRDLISRAALGTTGLRKVYIIDEVHMLTTAASNTLLKTLEEPPSHVVFVLATTDPQKVLPTIVSRVQHFQFHLLGSETLGDLVRTVNADAGLGLAADHLDRVVRRGAGSARDALSVLDQVAALGGADDEIPVAAEILEALVERDPARALTAVAGGCAAGRDPRRLAEETLAALRDVFLAGRAPALVDLPPADVERVAEVGRKLGSAALLRAMEMVAEALGEMREALDPRVNLEVALVRVTAPDADISPAALLERIERLERGPVDRPDSVPSERSAAAVTPPTTPGRPTMASIPPAPPPAPRPTRPVPVPSVTAPPTPPAPPGGRTLGSYRVARPTPPIPPAGAPSAAAEPEVAAVAPTSTGEAPSREELTKAWGDHVLARLSARARARFAAGRFVAGEGGRAVFALPGIPHRDQCLPLKGEVEDALSTHFGRPFPLDLVADAPPVDQAPEDDSSFSMDELRSAPGATNTSPADRVKSAFPGAKEVAP